MSKATQTGGGGSGAAVQNVAGGGQGARIPSNRPKIEQVGWCSRADYDAAIQLVADETFPHRHRMRGDPHRAGTGLWLGDKRAAGIGEWYEIDEGHGPAIEREALADLRRDRIGGIVTITNKVELKFEHNGIEYYCITIPDDPTPENNEIMRTKLPAAFEFIRRINQQGSDVLVHCQLGSSRSCTCVVAFMMEEEKRTFKDVYDQVKRIRAISRPLFFDFLCEFEHFLRVECDFKLSGQDSVMYLLPGSLHKTITLFNGSK
jgi:Dual specificity phosphatase, catalytic domain